MSIYGASTRQIVVCWMEDRNSANLNILQMDSTHKEHFMNRIGNRMMLWRYAVVCLLTWLYSGEKSISPMKL